MPSNKPAAKLRLNRKTIIHLRNIAQLNGGQDTTTIPETGTISGGMTTCAGIPTATQRPMPGKPH